MIPKLETSPELIQLLKEAAQHVMTSREVWQQRVSFTFGQLMEVPGVTREHVVQAAVEMYGECPFEEPNAEDLDDMLHALGRPVNLDKLSYRNNYCVATNSPKAKRFEALGCWDKAGSINNDCDTYYTVNDLGLLLLKEHRKSG